jgi:hypothetical protein
MTTHQTDNNDHGGNIVFSDGSVLDSIENIALLNADNVMTGTNTLTGDVITSTTSSSLYTDGALVVSGGAGIAENLRVNGRAIFNDILAVYQDVSFYKSNSFWEYHFTVPTLDGHLTNKLYVDGSIATAVATETASILADDNVFTGLNSFTQDLGTTGISNTGNLVMDTEASEIRWNSKQEFMIQDYFTANNRFGFVIGNGQVRMFMSNSHTHQTFYLVRL